MTSDRFQASADDLAFEISQRHELGPVEAEEIDGPIRRYVFTSGAWVDITIVGHRLHHRLVR